MKRSGCRQISIHIDRLFSIAVFSIAKIRANPLAGKIFDTNKLKTTLLVVIFHDLWCQKLQTDPIAQEIHHVCCQVNEVYHSVL